MDTKPLSALPKYTSQLSYVPMRAEPGHRSEQVSQLLLGEPVDVIAIHDNWSNIRLDFDGYTGWVETKVLIMIDDPLVEPFMYPVSKRSVTLVSRQGSFLDIPLGAEFTSRTPILHNELISLPGETFVGSSRIDERIVQLANNFIGTPYLWGGRTDKGIDCSGLVQVIFKSCGIKLPRDASQQVSLGAKIESVQLAKMADLAFFSNSQGKITHVGILTGQGQIIHASGWVRIDSIDDSGIFDITLNKYTHQLDAIRRFL